MKKKKARTLQGSNITNYLVHEPTFWAHLLNVTGCKCTRKLWLVLKQNQWLERRPDFEPTPWPFPKTKLKVPTKKGLASKHRQPFHNFTTLDSINFSFVSSSYVEAECHFNQKEK